MKCASTHYDVTHKYFNCRAKVRRTSTLRVYPSKTNNSINVILKTKNTKRGRKNKRYCPFVPRMRFLYHFSTNVTDQSSWFIRHENPDIFMVYIPCLLGYYTGIILDYSPVSVFQNVIP